MPDFRSYSTHLPEPGSIVELDSDESSHLVAANRAREGSTVVLFDGKGCECDATLIKAHRRSAQLRIESKRFIAQPAKRVALAQAIPKGKLLEVIIRKATEIGIQTLYPLLTQRVESKIEAKKEGQKRDKWLAASLEGAKQSGNPYLLDLSAPLTLEELLTESSEFELKLVASLSPQACDARSCFEEFRQQHDGRAPTSVLWIVGPEGDLTDQETQLALQSGFKAAALQANVLKCETAATYAMSVSRYELGPA